MPVKRGFLFCGLAIHLDVCPKMQVPCALCGTELCRDSIAKHTEQVCPEKEIQCPFLKYNCVMPVKRKDMDTHLEEKRTEHMELKLNSMEDAIAKQNKLIEKQHEEISKSHTMENDLMEKQEVIILKVHSMEDLIAEQSKLLEKQNKKISKLDEIEKSVLKQNERIDGLNTAIWDLKKNIVKEREKAKRDGESDGPRCLAQSLKNHPNYVKLHWRITTIPDKLGMTIKEQFEVAGYYIELQLLCKAFPNLIMHLCTQNGRNYDKLKWPFKAEFVTCLINKTNPENSEERKTEFIEVGRKDFSSSSCFEIGVFTKSAVLDISCRGRGADFEIFVIF